MPVDRAVRADAQAEALDERPVRIVAEGQVVDAQDVFPDEGLVGELELERAELDQLLLLLHLGEGLLARLDQTRQLGGFVMLVVNAAVGFILWYTFDRQADGIQPLPGVPKAAPVEPGPPRAEPVGG